MLHSWKGSARDLPVVLLLPLAYIYTVSTLLPSHTFASRAVGLPWLVMAGPSHYTPEVIDFLHQPMLPGSNDESYFPRLDYTHTFDTQNIKGMT